jgi:pimeloyl-ACP methyl ester carboxylesterase
MQLNAMTLFSASCMVTSALHPLCTTLRRIASQASSCCIARASSSPALPSPPTRCPRMQAACERKAPFVLVHGAWHSGACWQRHVAPALERRGHPVAAPDLPGHGEDTTPAAELSLDAYVDRVCAALAAMPAPAILVAHSMAGGAASAAAARRPELVRALVYVAAAVALPREDASGTEVAPRDDESLCDEAVAVDAGRGVMTVRAALARALLYADCSDEDAEWAMSLLAPEALGPTAAPLSLGPAFARVPKAYVRCLRDRCCGPTFQARMAAELRCAAVAELDCGHSPFLACPDELVDQLVALASLE